MIRVLLLRHGQSTWNAERRWQGQADPPLSPLGLEQAAFAAERVGALGAFAIVAASDLERAAVTASVIADTIGAGPVLLDQRLRENHAGEWQGLTHDEIDAQWPNWINSGRRPPRFEHPSSVAARAAESVRSLAAVSASTANGADVVGVSHGGTIRMLRNSLGAPDQLLGNLSGGWFHVDDDGSITIDELVWILDESLRTPRTRAPESRVE